MRRSSLHVISVIRWQWVLVLHREAKVVLASDSDSLVSKSRYTKSAVWIYFGFEADEEGRPKIQDAVVCRMCKISVSAKGGNTSNLLLHLKVHHPQWHLEVKKANSKPSGKDKDHTKTGKASSRQPSLSNTLPSGHKYERKSRKWQQLTDAVTYCLAKDMMPIYSVEKKGLFVYSILWILSMSCKAVSTFWTLLSPNFLEMSFQQKSKAPSLLLQQQICGPVTLLSHTWAIQYILWGRTGADVCKPSTFLKTILVRILLQPWERHVSHGRWCFKAGVDKALHSTA